MDLNDWLEAARTDAQRRGLIELQPMLDTLVRATQALRQADWNDDPRGSQEDRPAAGRSPGIP